MSGLLDAETIRERLLASPGWLLEDGHHLAKEWRFADFAAALGFLNRAAAICEQLDHHADFELAWGRVGVKTWSHDAGGVTERDLRLVAEIESIA